MLKLFRFVDTYFKSAQPAPTASAPLVTPSGGQSTTTSARTTSPFRYARVIRKSDNRILFDKISEQEARNYVALNPSMYNIELLPGQ